MIEESHNTFKILGNRLYRSTDVKTFMLGSSLFYVMLVCLYCILFKWKAVYFEIILYYKIFLLFPQIRMLVGKKGLQELSLGYFY